MKLTLAIAVLLLSSATNVSRAAVSPDKTEQGVRQTDSDYHEALLRNDVTAFSRIIADDYTYIDPRGGISYRQQLLDNMRNAKWHYESLSSHDVTVRLYGDVAVVIGRFSGTWRGNDQDFSGRYRYTR